MVTFFAAAKKVTAAPHRGNANKPKALEQGGKLKRPMVFNRPTPYRLARGALEDFTGGADPGPEGPRFLSVP